MLKANSSLKVYVIGHTDMTGELEYNMELSGKRAEAVVYALVDKYGIAADRLVAKGVGPLSPVSTNKTEEGRKLNRRVELVEM
jgi:OOP family OmpA-OmpF porin